MMTFNEEIAAATSIDAVLAIITDRQFDDGDFSSLPTFGGVEPAETQGVWSWDDTRLIVGLCADDFEIVWRADL